MHYYKFNIADYRKDTAHLSIVEHYIYRTLIDWYYMDGGFPKDERKLVRLLRLEPDQLINLRDVLSDFFIETDDGYFHQRINDDLVEYEKKANKNKVNGKRGGRPNKTQLDSENNPVGSKNNPVGYEKEPTGNPNHKPLTTNYKKDKLPYGNSSPKGDPQKNCPHKEIIAAYHELLPSCPAVKEWNATRKSYLKSRWNENSERQSVEWWRKYFSYVGDSKFLTGKTDGQNGKPPFVANLEWLVKPTNFAKIVEGNYNR